MCNNWEPPPPTPRTAVLRDCKQIQPSWGTEKSCGLREQGDSPSTQWGEGESAVTLSRSVGLATTSPIYIPPPS